MVFVTYLNIYKSKVDCADDLPTNYNIEAFPLYTTIQVSLYQLLRTFKQYPNKWLTRYLYVKNIFIIIRKLFDIPIDRK